MRRAKTRYLSVGISAAASRPFPSLFSRRFCRTIFELRRADLTLLGGASGLRRRDVLDRARLSAMLSPVVRGNFFPRLEDMLICTPGDLKSIPLAGLFLFTAPGIRREMLRE